jgi:exo-beta-1,3-glucanase (GH17 family)
MKGGSAVAALAMAGGAVAGINHRHAHELFHKRGNDLCTTTWTTIVGEPTWVPAPPPPKPTTTKKVETSTSSVVTPTPTPEPTTSTTEVKIPLPTPEPHDCPTPGTYTFTETTVVVDKTTTVCAATSTALPPGTHTYGGVTTVVEEATTVTCPYATVSTSGTVTTSVIQMTEYVCPSAGTYTIAPTTTECVEETTIVYPVPTTVVPGTYTAPATTITVTETGYVYYCPYTSSGLAEPTSAPAPAPVPEVKPEPVPEATVAKPETKPEPETESQGIDLDVDIDIGLGGIDVEISLGSTNGDHYGITYTPYESANGNCKDAYQVEQDIIELKDDGFDVLRIYSTDCNTLETVGPAAKKHGLELIIGVFVKETGCSYDTPEIKEQVDTIASWAQWDMTKLIVVGNEARMAGFCEPEELAELVTVVRSKCSGYNGPFTVAETLNIWQQPDFSSVLCDVVDVTGANIHPYFNYETSASMAGDFVLGQLGLLKDICHGKDPINLECGWPTSGTCNGAACPGKAEQAEAIKSIRDKAGALTIFFSFEDDHWKEPGECGCERSWGSKDCFKAW